MSKWEHKFCSNFIGHSVGGRELFRNGFMWMNSRIFKLLFGAKFIISKLLGRWDQVLCALFCLFLLKSFNTFHSNDLCFLSLFGRSCFCFYCVCVSSYNHAMIFLFSCSFVLFVFKFICLSAVYCSPRLKIFRLQYLLFVCYMLMLWPFFSSLIRFIRFVWIFSSFFFSHHLLISLSLVLWASFFLFSVYQSSLRMGSIACPRVSLYICMSFVPMFLLCVCSFSMIFI